MPRHYYSIGTTLANMVNIETVVSHPPNSLDGNRIPLLGPIVREAQDHTIVRTGSINKPLSWDIMTQAGLRSLINDYFGGYSVASKAFYVCAIDESGYYAPFAVTLTRPVDGEHYTPRIGGYMLDKIVIPGAGWVLQTATKTGNFTVTTSTHHLVANTAGGSITFALPAISGVPQNVPYTFVKSSGSNNMVLDPNSTETIDGASTLTVTALNAVTVIVNNGTQWVTI